MSEDISTSTQASTTAAQHEVDALRRAAEHAQKGWQESSLRNEQLEERVDNHRRICTETVKVLSDVIGRLGKVHDLFLLASRSPNKPAQSEHPGGPTGSGIAMAGPSDGSGNSCAIVTMEKIEAAPLPSGALPTRCDHPMCPIGECVEPPQQSQLVKARNFTARAHASKFQTYGGSGGPYLIHLDMVDMLLLEWLDSLSIPKATQMSLALRVGGRFHDYFEDCCAHGEWSNEVDRLRSLGFSTIGLGLALCVSDEPAATRDQAKQNTYRKINGRPMAAAIKLADRVAHLRFSLADPKQNDPEGKFLKLYLSEDTSFREGLSFGHKVQGYDLEELLRTAELAYLQAIRQVRNYVEKGDERV